MVGQETFFGKKTISTISFNEQEIITDILHLHSKNGEIDCDPTYSIGNFYKNWLKKPVFCSDLHPKFDYVVEAMSNNLPLEDSSVNTIMFDPPFVIDGANYNEAKEGSCIISKRFSSFNSWDELKTMYHSSMVEFKRILIKNGIVIFKCQDVVSSGKNHMTHSWLFSVAVELGFYPKDLFILLAKNRIIDGREQKHARKFHSYFWVFQKRDSIVKY